MGPGHRCTIARMPYMPPFIAPTRHTDPATALAQVGAIYAQQISHLRDAMRRFVAGRYYPICKIRSNALRSLRLP